MLGNFTPKGIYRCYNARCITTTPILTRSLRLKDQRLPKSAPKRINPFLYRYDKKARPRRLERWNVLGYGNIPFEKKAVHEYGLNPKDVHPTKWGGNRDLVRRIGEDVARFGYQPGYFDKSGKFVVVPEMIPEFIVPDLTDFELKPYVPYDITGINQSEFTARDLFISTYGQELVNKNLSHSDVDTYVKQFKEKQNAVEDKLADDTQDKNNSTHTKNS